ncbi:MAG: TorF family putative porin [Gallionella sp.]
MSKVYDFKSAAIMQTACIILCLLCATTARAEVTANLSLTSDYVFRGISNSNRRPALQGGIDYAHPDGWYVGSWASNVDFMDGGEAKVEIDGYVGHAGSAGKLSWNAGWMTYVYPGASQALQYDTHRLSAGVQYEFSPALVGLYCDRIENVFGSGPADYLEASLVVPLREAVSLDMRIGRQRYSDNTLLTMPDFTYRSASLIWQPAPWEMRLAWQDNGVAEADCFSGKNWCGPVLLLQITRRFELAQP